MVQGRTEAHGAGWLTRGDRSRGWVRICRNRWFGAGRAGGERRLMGFSATMLVRGTHERHGAGYQEVAWRRPATPIVGDRCAAAPHATIRGSVYVFGRSSSSCPVVSLSSISATPPTGIGTSSVFWSVERAADIA